MQYKMKFMFIFLTLAIPSALGSYEQVKLVKNGYEGMVIAINPEVPEDSNLIDSLKAIWTDASTSLYQGTKKRAYFKDITILVPTTWNKGSYHTAGKVSYDQADVLVANPNPAFGDKPYTLQFGECGAHGEYIHLTPDYITEDEHVGNYGPKGTTMVHEWAHLRWGVFDESASNGYPEFYYRDNSQEIEATRCPASLEGKHIHVYNQNGNVAWEDCVVDMQTGFPTEGKCSFIPNEHQDPDLTTSMMSHYYLNQVVHFCHDDESDPTNKHNKEAPNEQNRLCSQRSTWDVITSSEDFTGQNSASSISNLVPKFNVVQAKTHRKYVLVLDTSGSMSSKNLDGSDTRMQNVITASSEFIKNYAPDNSFVGIVDFDSYAKVNSDLELLQNDQDREDLVADLPDLNDAGGNTYLYEGVDVAVDMLVDSGNPEGAEILMLTDGDGYWDSSTEATVKAKGIVFTTIFFGVNKGNDFLIQLSEDTNGIWTMANDLDALLDIFEKVSHVDSGSTADKSFQVKNEKMVLTGSEFTGKVSMDSSIGGNTVFSFTYSGSYSPYIDLYEPSGRKFCSENHYPSGCDATTKGTLDTSLKTIAFKISGTAKTGEWLYKITPYSTSPTTVTASVSSMAADPNVEPIMVKSGMSRTGISSATPIVVYAQVTQGYNPILNVEARATVVHPDGATTDLILQDNGAAPDVRKSDGIYSKYFLDYSISGRYSVKVQVIGKGNETSTTSTSASSPTSSATLILGVVKSDGTIALNQNYKTDEIQYVVDAADVDPFERVDSLGGFEYTGPTLSKDVDLFPPSQIIDLQAQQVDVDDVEQGFRLLFTAPGNDFDEGTAKQYKIHYTFNDTSSLVPNFETLPELKGSAILDGDLKSPKAAGSWEMFTVKINHLPKTEDVIKVGFAVKAYDKAGNSGAVSNIALLNIFLISPEVITNPCIDDNGHILKGQRFPVADDCSKFYRCNATGHPIERTCKKGLVFNPVNRTCDLPKNVPSCNYKPSNETTPAKEVCVNDDGSLNNEMIYLYAANCKYYKCKQGVSKELVCPIHMSYDPERGVCNWISSLTHSCTPDHTNNQTIIQPSLNCTASESSSTEPSFVGFVIDDTGTMEYEIEAIHTWLTNCIGSSNTSCAVAPTGGWILTSFNDPNVGTVVGPSTDLSMITSAVGLMSAHGGGDCPERAFAGIMNAISAVDETNSQCKIFFVTDATAKDEGYFDQVQDLFTQKGCTFNPLLTSCCTTCEDPCLTLDVDYCTNSIIDKSTIPLSPKKSTVSGRSNEEFYYDLAYSSGGKIYFADKPSSSDEFLKFLENELTLGFCPTDKIAGPAPHGYTSEKDCISNNSCWDRVEGKCYLM